MTQTAPEGQPATGGQGQQQAGAPAIPAGVQPHSAAGQAAAAAAAAKPAEGDQKPAGYVPVGELAQERQKRHELEQKVAGLEKAQTDQLNAFKQALGLGGDAQTPEQIAAQAQQVQTQQNEAVTQLAVYQLAGPAGADAAKLLDSAKFLRTLKTLQPTDHAGITKAITDALEENKSLAVGKVAPAGAGDAGQGSGGSKTAPSINDLIRAAAGFGGQ